MRIFDSGAIYHYFQFLEGLTEFEKIDKSIKIGSGDSVKTTKTGDLKCEGTYLNGEKITVTLNDVKYLSNLCVNSFSLNKALKKVLNVINHNVIVRLKHVRLTLYRVINPKDGCVTGVLMKPITNNNINGFANASISDERTYEMNHLYKLFGNCSQ
jgi:hypothetical protein